MTTLEVTNRFFTTAMEKLFHDGPYIGDGYEKQYREDSIFDIVKILVEEEAAGPVFREYIQEKNGITPEVECLRVEFLEASVSKLKESNLLNQILLEYADKDAAAVTGEHAEIV